MVTAVNSRPGSSSGRRACVSGFRPVTTGAGEQSYCGVFEADLADAFVGGGRAADRVLRPTAADHRGVEPRRSSTTRPMQRMPFPHKSRTSRPGQASGTSGAAS